MEKVDHIIHAKWVITCEENNRILEDHALVVKANKIHTILPSAEVAQHFTAAHEHDYKRHAVLPGFINSHTHIAMNVFRGLADDLPLMDWLKNYIWPAETRWVSPELVADASALAMAEMIRCGTTCFNDMYYFLDETAQAADVAGIRAHLGMTVISLPTAWAKTTQEYFKKGQEFFEKYKNHDRIHATLAPHSTYTLSMEDLTKVKQWATKYNLRINIHLQETATEVAEIIAKYNKTPLQLLDDIGMVSPELIAVHMTQITDADFAILQKRKPNIVHCPESNMKLASGACPVQRLRDAGINVALGTDGAASNNDLDMLSEMRSAALLGKLTANDSQAVDAAAALQMATLNGAKALGIQHITGSLEAGKSADFIAIDLEQIETQPLYHPVSQIVYAASRQQVTDVWVAGKQLMKNRVLTTLDEKALIEKAHHWRDKIK